MRRVGRRAAFAFATAAFALTSTTRAGAFCRTTTCDPNAGEECRKNQSGCIRDGVALKWKSLPIVYRFHRAGSTKLDDRGARTAIRRAFDTWTNVECADGRTSLRFEEGPDVTKDKPLGEKRAPEKFGIYFRDETWPHNNGDESLALTNQIYGEITGNIDYADIEINTADTRFALIDTDEGPDLQAVMTHEVGHYIGLAHSFDPDSIMVARYCQNADLRCGESVDRARALSDDDNRAVCAAYPPARAESTGEAPGCAEAPARGPWAPRAVLGAAVFAAVAVARRRRRAVSGAHP